MVGDAEEKEAGRRAHDRLQAEAFDRVADVFEQPLPEDVARRTAAIVWEAEIAAGAAVLDVGTGTGVLIPYILSRRPARVVACDLSLQMLSRARRRFGERVAFLQADVVDLPSEVVPFDFVFCNAVFGNFYDEGLALAAMNRLLGSGGRLIISHPMGRGFVAELRRKDPELVRRELPTRDQAEELLRRHGLRLVKFRDEEEFYLAVATKAEAVPGYEPPAGRRA
ncbi:MAG: class I SAM-dependent methyltransferase [Dehalococcoidia bacterium]